MAEHSLSAYWTFFIQGNTICLKHILRLVSYCNRTYFTHNQHLIFYLDILVSARDLHQKKVVSSSSSCHGGYVMWQEISHTCGLACSCPHPCSRIVLPLSEHVLLLWSTEYFVRFSVQNCSGRPWLSWDVWSANDFVFCPTSVLCSFVTSKHFTRNQRV